MSKHVPTPADPLLDWQQAATYLNVPETMVRRLVNERRVAFHKVGRYVRFKRDDLDTWLAAHRTEAMR